jgi:hypothetical protein
LEEEAKSSMETARALGQMRFPCKWNEAELGRRLRLANGFYLNHFRFFLRLFLARVHLSRFLSLFNEGYYISEGSDSPRTQPRQGETDEVMDSFRKSQSRDGHQTDAGFPNATIAGGQTHYCFRIAGLQRAMQGFT